MVYPSGTDLPGCPGKKAVKRLCVCVCSRAMTQASLAVCKGIAYHNYNYKSNEELQHLAVAAELPCFH